MKQGQISFLTLWCVIVFSMAVHFLYYPKWSKPSTEATISWDVSGYYMYLPATFIYKDLKKCRFLEDIITDYSPTPDFQQAFIHKESGNYVMKHSLGQALQMSPFFALGHAWASSSSKYPSDGFSFPYQFMISMGSLLFLIIGLVYTRKILLEYFDDKTSAITLLALVLGTNYLNYSAIDGAVIYNNLFALYAVLIWLTIGFYKRPTFKKSALIGLVLGVMALTRSADILALVIPLFFGVNVFSEKGWQDRSTFVKKHIGKFLLLMAISASICFLQLVYWWYVTGSWAVVSSESQGYNWFSPQLLDGIFGFRSGWLIYTPMMIFALIGFYFLYKKDRALFSTSFLFTSAFIYIAFAWDIWWFGGSLGQRTLIAAYPVLVFPLAAYISWCRSRTGWLRWVPASLAVLFVYLNLWFTHQAHRGGLLHLGQMTQAYYWKTVGRFTSNTDYLKLLDNKDYYDGARRDVNYLHKEEGRYEKLTVDDQFSQKIFLPLSNDVDWVRASVDVKTFDKEWDAWKMGQLVVRFYLGKNIAKERIVRLQRHMIANDEKQIHIDVKLPRRAVSAVEVFVWQGGSEKPIEVKNFTIETYNEG